MTALLALAACRKEPDMTETDGKYLVYTSYDADTDFSVYSTFIVADSMFVMNSGNSGYVSEDDDSEVREILDARPQGGQLVELRSREEAERATAPGGRLWQLVTSAAESAPRS